MMIVCKCDCGTDLPVPGHFHIRQTLVTMHDGQRKWVSGVIPSPYDIDAGTVEEREVIQFNATWTDDDLKALIAAARRQ